MSRLPTPGSDSGSWGDILNEFLSVEHNSDGTLKETGTLATMAADDAVMHNSGDETITGTKTFFSSPEVPIPTLPGQATNKSYVDNTIASLTGIEPTITAGTTSQYWRGDKSWQTLDKAAVGLSAVDDTSDVNKPVSTAQAAADALKLNLTGGTLTGTLTSQSVSPTTDATYTLGDSTHYWVDGYFGQLNLNSTASITGATAGQINLDGNVLLTSTIPTANSLEIAGTVANSASNFRSLRAKQIFTGSADGVGAIESQPTFSPATSITTAYGFINLAKGSPAAGVDIGNLIGGFNRIDSGSTGGTITQANTMFVASPSLGTVKPTTLHGVQVQNQGIAGITTSYGLKINNQANAATSYGIVTGTGINSFGDLTGLMTTAPTHSLTLGATATGAAFYNTADQTVNFERIRIFWSGNIFTIGSEVGGTGTTRSLQLRTTSRQFIIADTATTAGFYQFSAGTNIAGGYQTVFSGGWGASSGTNVIVSINPNISHTSTAGYTALLVNPIETTIGSGPKLLADFQLGGTSKLNISSSGLVTLADAVNLVLGTTTGTKIGTATTQKLGFYNATPVIQPTGNALTALSALGLVGTPTLAKADVGLSNVDNTSDAVKAAAIATLTNKTLTSPIIRGSAVIALTDGATIATDASLGNIFTVTIAGNRTISNPTNPTDGQKIIYRLKQDVVGSRTITWGAAFRFGADVPTPTLTPTAAKTDYIGFIYNSTDTTWDCLAVTRGL